MLKQALKTLKEAVIPGQEAAFDEQTNGFQGVHEDKKVLMREKKRMDFNQILLLWRDDIRGLFVLLQLSSHS